MVPESDDPPANSSESGSTAANSERNVFDESRLYSVVHDAVEDALFDVIGTVLLVAIAVVLVIAGGQAILWSLSPLGMVAGVAVTMFGVYLAAATLELVPPVREWV